MKFRTLMICAVLLVFGLQLYGQQADSASRMTPRQCLGQPGRLPGIMNRACKPVLDGAQTPQPSNDPPHHDDGAIYITFDAPGAGAGDGQGTVPFAINVFGMVTGFYTDATYAYHGFLRGPSGDMVRFDLPGAAHGTFPSAINAEGTITGVYCDVNFVCPGFMRRLNGTITTFDVPGNLNGLDFVVINPEGTITGDYYDANFNGHGFLRARDGTITTYDVPGAVNGTYPSGINPSGTIAGSSADENYRRHGFLRDRDGTITAFDVPGGRNTGRGGFQGGTPVSINPKGEIASAYFQPIPDNPYGGNFRGLLRKRDGGFETFDAATYPPCCIWTWSTGITPDGTITGYDNDGHNLFHGFLRTRDGTVTTFDAPGAGTGPLQGTLAFGINPERVITGYYWDANQVSHGFLRIPR